MQIINQINHDSWKWEFLTKACFCRDCREYKKIAKYSVDTCQDCYDENVERHLTY